ncbi:MAG: right-handed parallel beta-helix repeat-containing protein [Candidatus Thermoplasmatota archaeon]|jgi:parallel beta-helix repeat protein|nr:right-handed parallel beta-helix repeat-containing protein [Candidatus Thermoplasmatota archaeon]
MNKEPLISKWLVVGIILLFVTMAFLQTGTSQTLTAYRDIVTKTSYEKHANNMNDIFINYSINNKGRILRFNVLLLGTNIISLPTQKIEKPPAPTSKGNWLFVGGIGPENYTRIQDAINASSDGDTVFVYNGIYQEERITINKSITLFGEDKNNTILDGQYSEGMILLVSSSDVVIRCFTLKNCKSGGFYQAIYLWGNPRLHNIIVSDCIMTNNDKGIFFINVTNLLVSFCKIHHNYAESLWGMNSSNIVVHNCTVSNNGAGGGGGYIPGGVTINWDDVSYLCSTVSIADCDIIANKYWGIAIENTKNIKINHNNISLNTIGIHFDGTPHLEIYDNIVVKNQWMGIEGHGFLTPPSSDVVIRRNNISQNGNGEKLSYGGIYLQHCPSIDIIDNLFYKNNIQGIFPNGSPETQIINNSFTDNKKGIYAQSAQCSISNNIFNNNPDAGIYIQTASEGMIINNNTIHGGGKGIHIGQASDGLHVFFNTITDNEIGISVYSSYKHNISSNTILNSSERALFLNSSCDNVLHQNNFINYSEDPYLYYNTGPKNRWMGNYWDRPRLLPKILIGTRLFSVNDLYLKLLVFEIDWYTAKEPYDIPGMS